MLTSEGLLSWFQRRNFPEPARATINQVRSAAPSRRVKGGRSNVSGRYPSRKMGMTIQFESHRVELAGIYEMEHDAGVLEYYDQPPPIKLDYESAAGKNLGVVHTPDFFVIRDAEAGWEEWKTEEDLQRLSEQSPNRYCAGADGRWCCPPGVAHGSQLGLYYRVRSSAEVDAVFQRNILFLEDYLRSDEQGIPRTSRDTVLALVLTTPGLSLEDLLRLTASTVVPDHVFAMIAADALYVDLRAAALAEPSRVKVFSTPEACKLGTGNSARNTRPQVVGLRCGSRISWDGRDWTVANLGETTFGLLSGTQDLVELPISTFEKLISENRLRVIAPEPGERTEPVIPDCLSRASEGDLRSAVYRAGLIGPYLDDGVMPESTVVAERTFFRWLAHYREAETAWGSGFLGLLPQSGRRGNREPKLPELSRRLLQEFIETDYETLKQKTKYASWIGLKLACETQGAPVPSYKTFCRAVSQRPAFDQTLKRKGRRASYQVATFFWQLDACTPRHGDRPFEIVHIDHTELDVECIGALSHRLGRPWLTLLTDAHSRRMLAFYLTFDPPSYRSCMMALRECIRRFGRFPQILVVDGGREFESTYFETLLARYECTKKTRPPAEARFGSTCERLFGAANTQFIHNLSGNTQITRNVRQITKSVDPKGHAIWPLAELHSRLAEYFYEVHDTIAHPALGMSPRETYENGLASGGARSHRMIAYNDEFLMMTLPTTSKGTAKVTISRGVKINHVYYWCEAFRQTEGEVVPVRYDPFDAGVAYAFVRKQWLQCHSECFAAMKGRTEREIMLASAELHRRNKNHAGTFHITARRLAEFLESVEAEELLLTQRLRDTENRPIRMGIVSNTATQDVQTPGTAASEGGHPPRLDDGAACEVYGAF